MLVTIVFATGNAGKLRELAALVATLGIAVRSVSLDVVEDDDTFEGNAEKKARAALEATGLPSLADDSGLEVDALSGMPGVRSARFAKEHDDAANNLKLLTILHGIPDAQRSARFRSALVYLEPGGRRIVAEGRCEGRILHEPRGTGGFGYDPLFLVEGGDRTMAELPLDEKNRISHRARAFASFLAQLRA
jgi:XTP/dITP diphosphohydrolase